ncbi:MAG: restriction endonuclease subunit S [Bacteroidales bacterium]|nr:restriction endonuclease subunit S [Bacteroidales bacterium]
MTEWKEYKLGELTIDGKGSYGIAAPAVDYDSNKYTYLRITDINDDGTLNKNGLKSVDDKNAHKYLLQQNDIVFARTGASVGRSYFYDERDGELVYAGFLIKYSIDPTKVNPKILKFYTHSQAYYDWIQTVDNGATRGNINAQTYASMPIILPERHEQDRIVSILSSLDDKIDLLHRENATLEQMAETLFRQWFVVEAKEEWEEGKLGDLIEVKYGKDHKKLLDGEIPVIGSGGIMRYADTALYDKESVLIPRKGTLNNVMYINEPFWTVDTMFYTEMRRPNIAKFVFHFMKCQDLANMNVGSAVPSMTTEVLNNIPIDIPPQEVFDRFENAVASLYSKKEQNNKQIQTLMQTRDGVLPRLMSGGGEIVNTHVQNL